MKKMKFIVAILVISLVATMSLSACGGGGSSDGGGGDAASGEKFNFVVQNMDPASSICGQYLEAWGSLITEESDGRIEFTFYHGGSLVGATEAVDAVLNGTADIAWSVVGLYPGRFPVAEGTMLPMMATKNARDGSAAAMEMYRQSEDMQAEFKDFHVIQMSACSYHPFGMANSSPKSASDLKGKRVRTPGATINPYLTALGMAPQVIPTPETYESLQKNNVDATVNDWHNIAANKLLEVYESIVDYPNFVSPLFMIMNKDSYAKLPDDLKAIFDKYSGDFASEMAGNFWDITRAWVIDNPQGVDIYEPDAAFVEELKLASVASHDAYIADLNSKGLDGQKVHDLWIEVTDKFGGKHTFDDDIDLSQYGVTVEQKS